MFAIDMSFSTAEKDLLRCKKGDVLESIGYVPMTPDVAFGRMRFYFSHGSIDIVSTMHELDYTGNGESDDDEAFISIEHSDNDLASLSEIEGDEIRVALNKTVERIVVAQDQIKSFDHGNPVFEIEYPQAVIFDFGDEMLSVDKQDCNWVMLTFKQGKDIGDLVYDTSRSWKNLPDDNETFHNKYAREYLEI